MKLALQFAGTNTKIIIISAIIIYHFIISGLFIHTFKILPLEFRWLTDVAILLLFVYSIMNRFTFRKTEKFYSIPKVFYLIVIFFIWGFITAVVNSVNFFTFLLQLKDYVRYIVLALAIINLNLAMRDIKWLTYLIISIILLQVPVSAIQCSLWTLGDWCVGTLLRGGTTDMVFLCCMGVSLIVSLYLYHKKKGLLLMLVPLFALPIIFGNNQMGIFLYPFTILFTFIYSFKRNVYPMLLTLGILCAFIAILYLLIPPFQSTMKRYVSLLDVSFKNQFVVSPDTLGRLKAPGVATEWLFKKDGGWLFGYGFGATKESYWKQTTGEYAHKKAPNKNQISTAIFETGYIGLVLFLSLFVWLLVWGNKMVKRLLIFPKSMALTFTCTVSLMIIGSMYTNVLKGYYFGFLFWVMFAFLYSLNMNFPYVRQKNLLTYPQNQIN